MYLIYVWFHSYLRELVGCCLQTDKCMFSVRSSHSVHVFSCMCFIPWPVIIGSKTVARRHSFAWLDARGMTSVASVCHSLRIMNIFTQSAMINQFNQWTVFPSYSFCDCGAFSACDCGPTAVPVCLQAFLASQSLLLPWSWGCRNFARVYMLEGGLFSFG